MPDGRIKQAHRRVSIRTKRVRKFPLFGEIVGLYWDGNDLGLGIIDRLNTDELLKIPIMESLRTTGDLEISARSDLQSWVLHRGEGRHLPSGYLWECYEGIARHLLETPLPAHLHPLRQYGRSAVAQANATLQDFPLEMVDLLLCQRSWLWRFHLNRAGQELAMKRIAALQVLLPTIIDRFIRHGALEPTARLTSSYVIGSYPWVPNPTDIDFLFIVEGEKDFTYLSSQQLKARDIQMPELPAGPAVETVGHETLLQACHEEPVPNAKRLALRYALLYGSALLAG